MPSKIILSERNAYNYNGNLILTLGAHENDKCYAVVAKCGHCGDGVFYSNNVFSFLHQMQNLQPKQLKIFQE